MSPPSTMWRTAASTRAGAAAPTVATTTSASPCAPSDGAGLAAPLALGGSPASLMLGPRRVGHSDMSQRWQVVCGVCSRRVQHDGPLVERAVPEWQTSLDSLLALPEIGGPVGYWGWTAVGIRLAVVEPRIAAAGFFAGGDVPRAQREDARHVTIPLLFLLQWTTKGTPGSWPWTCSTPSAPRRGRCTRIRAGTPAPRGWRWTTGPGSSPGT